MATGGRRSFTASSYKGSDEIFDNPCTPCSNEGNNVEAVNFCSDCSEYFCLACTRHHKKFSATSGHHVVNRTRAGKPAGTGGQTPGTLLTETCLKHHGELITAYCEDHDLIACITCVTEDHVSCKISSISKIAGGSKQSEDIPRVKTEVSESIKALSKAKISLQKRQTSLDGEKSDHLKRIQHFTERLIKNARDLQKAAEGDVKTNHTNKTEKLQSEIKSIETVSTRLSDRLRNLDNAGVRSDAQVFVDIVRGKNEAEKIKQLEQRLQTTGLDDVKNKFVFDDNAERFLDGGSLGKLVENKPFQSSLNGTYDVKIKGDKYTCWILDICELFDGRILVTDLDNKSIKEIDKEEYKVVRSFNMPSLPCGICATSKYEVAVTLTLLKTVQFMNIRGSWKLTRTLKVDDRCRGIQYSNGLLFISCGGHVGNQEYEPEGPGFMGVYDMSGSLLRKVQLYPDGSQIFSVPYGITTTDGGNKINVADKKGGVITLSRQGSVLWTFSNKNKWTTGVSAVTEDSLLVCGRDPMEVLQIEAREEINTKLLDENDLMNIPDAVMYLRSTCRLLVALKGCDKIKVFDIVPSNEPRHLEQALDELML